MTFRSIPTTDFLKQIFPTECHDRIFLVGGIVRDLLSGRENRDIDLTAALSPQEFRSCGFRRVTGKTTSAIWFMNDAKFGTIEITPLLETGGLPEDLARRDFTINAIAMNMFGEVIDPLGGRKEHEYGLLKVCSDNAFNNDPLRIFRALRFEADGWRMTSETETLISGRDWSKPLNDIPVERFTREMLKALELKFPERFFQRMLKLGVGENFLPELFRMQHIPAGPLIHHPEGNLFNHCCQVLQRVSSESPNLLTRFCAFFHDIGKLASDPAHYPKHHGHDQAGYELARAFCDRLRLPASYRTALAWTSRLHGKLNLWDQLRDATRVRTAEQALKGGIAEVLPLVSAAEKADCSGHDGWLEAVRVAGLTTSELGIIADRLEDLPPGKRTDLIFQKKVEHFRAAMIKLKPSISPRQDPDLLPVP
jgi:tRNA nucleotidyltransferase (CCA-adding enzyme)